MRPFLLNLLRGFAHRTRQRLPYALLLFTLLLAALWLFSYWNFDSIDLIYHHTGRDLRGNVVVFPYDIIWSTTVASSDGTLSIEGSRDENLPYTNDPRMTLNWSHDSPAKTLEFQPWDPSLEPFTFLGFTCGITHPTGAHSSATNLQLIFPYWMLLLALAPLDLWLLHRLRLRFRQAHRSRTNLCLTCGYDLRASPNRCPECGTSPTNFTN